MRIKTGILIEIGLALVILPTGILVNRFLGAEDRGYLAACMLMPTLVARLISCQWERTLKADIVSKRDSAKTVWIRTRQYMGLMLLAAVPMLYLLVQTQDNILTDYHRQLVYLFALVYIPGWTLMNFGINHLLATGTLRWGYGGRCIAPLGYFALVLGSVLLAGLTLERILTFNVISQGLAVLVVLIALRALVFSKPLTVKWETGRLLGAWGPFALEMLAYQVDIWVLTTWSEPEIVGAYAAFLATGVPVLALVQGLVNVGSSRIQWSVRMARNRFLKLASSLVCAAGGSVAVLCYFFGEEVVGLLLGESYVGMAWMLPLVAVAHSLGSLNVLLLMGVQLTGAQKTYLRLQQYGSVIYLVFLPAGFHLWGLDGFFVGLLSAACLRVLLTTAGLMRLR